MTGRGGDEVLSLTFREIFRRPQTEEFALPVVHAMADKVVELAHEDGSVVRALMSRSALVRTNDQIALATFQDLTEQLWTEER
jgi:hypothetical protein